MVVAPLQVTKSSIRIKIDFFFKVVQLKLSNYLCHYTIRSNHEIVAGFTNLFTEFSLEYLYYLLFFLYSCCPTLPTRKISKYQYIPIPDFPTCAAMSPIGVSEIFSNSGISNSFSLPTLQRNTIPSCLQLSAMSIIMKTTYNESFFLKVSKHELPIDCVT